MIAMDVTARLRFARISPRKVRLVANMLRGLSVAEAEKQLRYLAPRSAQVMLKLLRSAMANAKQNYDLDPKALVVREVAVGSGVTLKRFMPRARGSAYRLEKKTSHIHVVLAEREGKGAPLRRAGKASQLETKKVEELSPEDLREQTKKPLGPSGEETVSRAVKPSSGRPLSPRRLFERRGGEK